MYSENISIMSVTPELAGKFLERNLANRRVNKNHVIMLANEMDNEGFMFNGDPIRFDREGNLLDGQHRLMAIKRTGKTQTMLVVNGLERKSFTTIDVGKTRSFGDVLSVNGVTKYQTERATMAKFIYMYENGLINRNESLRIALRVRSHTKLLEFYNERQDGIEYSLSFVNKLGKCIRKVSTISIMATMHYEFSKIDPLKANIFIEKVAKGVKCNSDDPAFVLREKLISSKKANRKMVAIEEFVLYSKAWNYERMGLKIQRLNYSSNLPRLI